MLIIEPFFQAIYFYSSRLPNLKKSTTATTSHKPMIWLVERREMIVLHVLHAFFHHEMKFSHLRFWRQRILGGRDETSIGTGVKFSSNIKARLTWKLYASPDSCLVSTNCPWVTVMTTTRTLWLSMKTIRANQAKRHFPHFIKRDQHRILKHLAWRKTPFRAAIAAP